MSGCAPTTEAESTAHYRRPVSNHYFDRFNCSRAEQQLHSAPNPGNYMITGLQPETTYNAFVSTKCSSGSTSMWGAGVNFTTFSEPSVRNAPESGIILLNAYPNPNNGKFELALKGMGDVKVAVSNSLGQVVFATETNLNGTATLDLDLKDAPKGMYFVSIDGAGIKTSEKVMVK